MAEKLINLCRDHYSPNMETITAPMQPSVKCQVLNCDNGAIRKVLLDVDEYGLAKVTYDVETG